MRLGRAEIPALAVFAKAVELEPMRALKEETKRRLVASPVCRFRLALRFVMTAPKGGVVGAVRLKAVKERRVGSSPTRASPWPTTKSWSPCRQVSWRGVVRRLVIWER